MFDVSTIARDCRLGPDGIWYPSSGRDVVSYPADGNEAAYLVEDVSWWFRHRNACIAAAVSKFPPPEGEPIFDIGGGNGFVSVGLNRAGFEVVLVEPGPVGAANAKARGVPVVICATPASAGLPAAAIGAVGLFDVIEHIEDDLAFLYSTRALMKDNGRLYATVPAYRALWSEEDRLVGHFR